jgi:hypothetical protein
VNLKKIPALLAIFHINFTNTEFFLFFLGPTWSLYSPKTMTTAFRIGTIRKRLEWEPLSIRLFCARIFLPQEWLDWASARSNTVELIKKFNRVVGSLTELVR